MRIPRPTLTTRPSTQQVALDVALGLHYLHSQRPLLVHRRDGSAVGSAQLSSELGRLGRPAGTAETCN